MKTVAISRGNATLHQGHELMVHDDVMMTENHTHETYYYASFM